MRTSGKKGKAGVTTANIWGGEAKGDEVLRAFQGGEEEKGRGSMRKENSDG